MAVLKSLMAEARVRPRIGWVRADQARSDEDIQRERELADELREANELIEKLEREIRDRAILGDEIPIESLAQGEDIIKLNITFQNQEKTLIREQVEVTWDELLRVIGPTIYGYIMRKRSEHGQPPTYPFQDNVEEHIRGKIIDRVQNRKRKLESSQIDNCILQFKELGLLMFAENPKEDGSVFRGVQLTELGEKRLTLLSARRRD